MPLDIARIQAICLDVDGTLQDTDDQLVLKVASWLARLQAILPIRDPHRQARRLVMAAEAPGNILLYWLDRSGLDGQLAALNEIAHRRGWRRTPAHFHIIPGVREALELLHGIYPLAIVSARGELGVHAFLDHFDLRPYFKVIATAQTRPLTKPHPDPLVWAAAQLGVTPADCLMVGDTTVDILCGRASGAQTVGVLCGFGQEAELRRAGADLILTTPAELPAVLLGSHNDPDHPPGEFP